MSTIKQRVLRARVLREREEQRQARKLEATANRRHAQEVAKERRLEALLDGRVEPRNARECAFLDRAEFGLGYE